jgi:hypothetical protein
LAGSDRIGRKYILLGGCALAALTYQPAFHLLARATNPALVAASLQSPVLVTADPGECSFQFDPVGKNKFDASSCDIAKAYLARNGIDYRNVAAPAGTVASVAVGTVRLVAPDPGVVTGKERAAAIKAYGESLKGARRGGLSGQRRSVQGRQAFADRGSVLSRGAGDDGLWADRRASGGTVPPKIRYTSMSLPYHIANGWFGGLLPTTAFAMVAATGDIYYGLWYPIGIAAATVVIGLFFLPETFRRNIDD